jgi:senataxin
LHREAATFLIFLFAYRRNSASRYWVDSLETVVSGCNRCARGFGAARRELGRK